MSSSSGRARTYRVAREKDMNIAPRSAYSTNRSPSQSPYAGYHHPATSQVLQYPPKSVITVAFYEPPQPPVAAMSDPSSTGQLINQSPLRRGGPGRVPRSISPKSPGRRQVGVKKLSAGAGVGRGGGGGVGGKVLSQQRTSSASPTTLGHYSGSNSGYFTITAYLPFDGGKRLKVLYSA